MRHYSTRNVFSWSPYVTDCWIWHFHQKKIHIAPHFHSFVNFLMKMWDRNFSRRPTPFHFDRRFHGNFKNTAHEITHHTFHGCWLLRKSQYAFAFAYCENSQGFVFEEKFAVKSSNKWQLSGHSQYNPSLNHFRFFLNLPHAKNKTKTNKTKTNKHTNKKQN